MLPPAPPRFSTTNGVPNLACRCCATMRPIRSAEPPAENGTMVVTCRFGQPSCACGPGGPSMAPQATMAAINRFVRLAFVLMRCFRFVAAERPSIDARAGGRDDLAPFRTLGFQKVGELLGPGRR